MYGEKISSLQYLQSPFNVLLEYQPLATIDNDANVISDFVLIIIYLNEIVTEILILGIM